MVTSSTLVRGEGRGYTEETAQPGLEVAASHSSLHPLLLSCDLAIVHRRAMQYSSIILGAEEEGRNGEMEGQTEGGREDKKRHTLSMSHPSDAGDRIQSFAHSK